MLRFFQQKCRILCFCDKKGLFYIFCKKMAYLKRKVWCQFITNKWQMRYNSKEEPIKVTHVNTQLN